MARAITSSAGINDIVSYVEHGVGCEVDTAKWRDWVEKLGVANVSPREYYGAGNGFPERMKKEDERVLLEEFFKDALLSGALKMNVDLEDVNFISEPALPELLIEIVTPKGRKAQWEFFATRSYGQKGIVRCKRMSELAHELRYLESVLINSPCYSVPATVK